MQIEVTIGPDGNTTILAISTIEDLWHDYQHFRDAALTASEEEPAFEQKRFLRAALMLFVAHCSGVVDSWCRKELAKDGKDSNEQTKWLRPRCMDVKCEYLSSRANLAGLQRPEFGFKKLRNRLAHVCEGEDLELFRDLSPSLLRAAEMDMVEWLELIGGALGHKRLPNSDEVMEAFSELGPSTRSESTKPPSAG